MKEFKICICKKFYTLYISSAFINRFEYVADSYVNRYSIVTRLAVRGGLMRKVKSTKTCET